MTKLIRRKYIVISWILVLLSCGIFIFFRMGAGTNYAHPDEVIPCKIIENINNSGKWDTNWILADLPKYFNYDQYNFSSYILFSAWMSKLILPALRIIRLNIDLLDFLRVLSAIFQVISIVLSYIVGKSLFNSRRVGLITSVLVATSPLLFQDSLYARPESFTTMLTLVLYLLTIRQYRKLTIIGFSLIGGLIGFLFACKFTFIVFLVLPAIIGFKYRNTRRLLYCVLILILGISFCSGFILGAPYALSNWSAYIHGLKQLFSQYGSSHLPYGLPDAGIFQRILNSWHYFAAIGSGSCIILAILGWILLFKTKQYIYFIIVGLSLSLVIYFSTKPVFFERNFSFTIPILSMSAGFMLCWTIDRFNINQPLRLILLYLIIIVITSFPFLFLWKLNHKVLSGHYEQQRQELHTKLRNQYKGSVQICEWMLTDAHYRLFSIQLQKAREVTVYEIKSADDAYTKQYINMVITNLGMRVIAKLRSPFQENGLPPSTLYTYHAPQYFYLTHENNLPCSKTTYR